MKDKIIEILRIYKIAIHDEDYEECAIELEQLRTTKDNKVVEREIHSEIRDILDNLLYWDTCPDNYKETIREHLTQSSPKQELHPNYRDQCPGVSSHTTNPPKDK